MYASPEQSGAANRFIDQRSDLYSLGAILYESLSGRPPFHSMDTLELIHQHLAKAPPSLIPRVGMTMETHPEVLPALQVVAAIIYKLLHKQAEERYQNTAGLMHDLKQVLALVGETSAQKPDIEGLRAFRIGQLDYNSQFRISQKLYGREKDIQLLHDRFRMVCSSAVRPSTFGDSSASVSGGSPVIPPRG